MKKSDWLRVKYFIYCLFQRSGYSHAKFLKKHNSFGYMGENCFFQPYNLPADAKQIRLGSNVVVASDVSFICHDVIHHMLNRRAQDAALDGGVYTTYCGVIEIKDNVFIGANSTILPNVTIGPNAVIAAGAVVSRNVPEGMIVGGVPAKVIGCVDDLASRRRDGGNSR